MDVDTYLLSAILGCILAWFCIMGWRRLIPVILVSFCFSTLSPAQGYDSDNDVPTLIEIRDKINAQMTMLDNYFSGYTAPNKLNDIDNSLNRSGNSAADYLQYLTWNTDSIEPKLDDIYGLLQDPYNISVGDRLFNIYNESVTTRVNTSDIANSLNYGSYSLADLTKYINDNVSAINNNSVDSLTELQDISNGQTYTNNLLGYNLSPRLDSIISNTNSLNGATFDQDNDVEAINEVRDAVNQVNSLIASLNSNVETMTSGSVGESQPTFDNGEFDSVQDFDTAIAGKADEIDLNNSIDSSSSVLTGLESFGDMAPDIGSSPPIPVIANMTLLGAGPINNVPLPFTVEMNDQLDDLVPIIYPIFTGILMGMIILFTYNRTALMISS